MHDEEIQSEVDRLRQLLLMTLRLLGISFKEIESRHNISHGYFSRVFSGKMDLRFEHIFQFCAYSGLTPAEFFQLAYPHRGEEPSEAARKLRQALHLFPGREPEVDSQPIQALTYLAPDQLDEILNRVEEVLRRELKTLHPPAAQERRK